MSKMIQIRNVPEDVHRKLKVRAAQSGMSLSDYLKQDILRMAQLPTVDEILEWSSRQPPVELSEPIEDIIRADRESHY